MFRWIPLISNTNSFSTRRFSGIIWRLYCTGSTLVENNKIGVVLDTFVNRSTLYAQGLVFVLLKRNIFASLTLSVCELYCLLLRRSVWTRWQTQPYENTVQLKLFMTVFRKLTTFLLKCHLIERSIWIFKMVLRFAYQFLKFSRNGKKIGFSNIFFCSLT